MPQITAVAPWFGSNRMLGKHVGEELAGLKWVGVPFAGGMSELGHITARTILVNDLHRHVMNLACVIGSGANIARHLAALPFHPDTLAYAQAVCEEMERGGWDFSTLDSRPCERWAVNYFVCCWMGRSNKCGIDDEFNGRPAIRWNAGGGDSAVRYRSALRSLVEWRRIMRRCTFETMDAFKFLARCEDNEEHGVYCDPPFPGVGRRYKFNAGKTEAAEREWHSALCDQVRRFKRTRVVMRFYDHPLIRELYPTSEWTWRALKGRDQANNADKPEVLLINGPSLTTKDGGLF